MKILLTILVFSIFVLPACGVDSSSVAPDNFGSPVTAPPDYAGKSNPFGSDAAVAGAVIFKTNCATCHGDNGLGDGPTSQSLEPRPANLVALNQRVGDDFLYWRISTGVQGTAMPAWKGILSDDQIWDVISYIRALK
jgi:mono/diheme cytochrome c family protein